MDRDEYDARLLSMLQDTATYKEINRDPAPGLRTKINLLLLSLKQQGELPVTH